MRFAVLVMEPPGSPDYGHAEIYAEIADALHFALLTLGYDSLLTDRPDLDDRCTIVLQPHMFARYGIAPPKNPIMYNLEPLAHRAQWWLQPECLTLLSRYPVWDYSQSNIDRMVMWQLPAPAHVQIGYVPELSRIADSDEDVDVLFYGALNDRRQAVLDELRTRGLRVETLYGVYGASRDAWIARSKIVINVHQFESQALEIARVSYLLANRRAVVSERRADQTEESDLVSGIAFARYDELADRCTELLDDERARQELRDNGYRAFSARSQVEILRRALASNSDLPALRLRP